MFFLTVGLDVSAIHQLIFDYSPLPIEDTSDRDTFLGRGTAPRGEYIETF
jgi:hypothetical protein